MKLDQLLSTTNVARFLGTTEETVDEMLADSRLGGVLIAALRNKGVAVTPGLKNSVESIVAQLRPPQREEAPLPRLDRSQLINSESTATIMFTDIVDSTVLTDKLGDRRSRELFRVHNEIVRRNTKTNGGAEVKNMGDGFMLTFNSARKAVTCATKIQRELAQHNAKNKKSAIRVRMGLSVGEPIREEEDLFGKSVVLAARVSAKAKGEQILICQIVQALIASIGEFKIVERGQFELKGISGVNTLYEVLWK